MPVQAQERAASRRCFFASWRYPLRKWMTCTPRGGHSAVCAARRLVKEGASNLRVKLEKRVQAALELRLDILPRAFYHVHGYVSLVAIGQFQCRVLDLRDLAFREQPQSVDKSQIRHEPHLMRAPRSCAGPESNRTN